MKKFSWIFVCAAVAVAACDLQPKIMSLPDSVGEFISARYPALLADPNTNPEIYNSAATDYGVYASPELYGSFNASDDYVMYASVDDYIVPPQTDDASVDTGAEIVVAQSDVKPESQPDPQVAQSTDYLLVPMYGGAGQNPVLGQVVVARGDTLYAIAKRHNTTVEDLARLNNLSAPYSLSVGQKLKIAGEIEPVAVANVADETDTLVINKPRAGVQTATRVALRDITVAPGDTLYSLSRKYSVPVNDLAVMNKLSAPFNLTVGQKIKVPDLGTAQVATVQSVQKSVSAQVASGATKTQTAQKSNQKSAQVAKVERKTSTKSATAPVVTQNKKISSDPTKKLPKISGRSSSKFSWPVRGMILSNYGAKSNGLFNDGINIGANRGTVVKAAENGVVAYAGNEVKGMGNLIIIQHSDGWMTVYAHLDSMVVRRGTKVSVGQKIGTVGQTGKVDKSQLHFEIRKGTKAYNPASYLKK